MENEFEDIFEDVKIELLELQNTDIITASGDEDEDDSGGGAIILPPIRI